MKKKQAGVFGLMLGVVLICHGSITGWAGTIAGTVEAQGVKSNANVVVYIDEIPGKEFEPPSEHALMDQVAKEFVPHVLPILKGTTVDFLNSDPFDHNVFSPDEVADRMNLGNWGQGEKRSFTFNKLGEAVILCNLHPEMEAWVVVLKTPYFAVSDGEGKFNIENVPAGTYTLKTWHKKLKPTEQVVVVPSEGSVPVQLSVSR